MTRRRNTFIHERAVAVVLGFGCLALVVSCGGDRDDGLGEGDAVRPGMPIHLVRQLDRATLEGGEIPSDLPPARVWDLRQGPAGWRSLPTLVEGSESAKVENTGSAMRLVLDETNVSASDEQPDWYGGLYLDVAGGRVDEWDHAIVEVRADRRVDDFGVGFNLRQAAGESPFEKWPTIFYVDGPPIEGGSEWQTLQVPFQGSDPSAPSGDEQIQQWALEFSNDEKTVIEVRSIRLVPSAARFAMIGGVGVQSVSNSVQEEFGPQREAIFAHAPARLSFEVEVPPSGRFDVGLGSFASATRLSVEVVDGDEVVEVLAPEVVPHDGPWQQRSVDLGRWAGRSTTLRLSAARGPGDDYGVALWSAPTVTSASAEWSADVPNVVFYVIDGASAGQMSVYGYERPTTPNLEKIASEGVVFERAYSNSTWTMSSTASFMTSLHHSVLGGLNGGSNPIPANVTTMAEHFKGAGFHTGIFTMNPNAAGLSGLTRGVDVVRDFGVRGSFMPHPIEAVSSRVLHEQFWQWRDAYPGRYWVHFQTTDVHPPYHPQEPFAGRMVPPERSEELAKQMMGMRFPFMHQSASVHEHWQAQLDEAGLDKLDFYGTMRDVHDEAMLHQDHHLGLLVDELKRRGEWENTLLIVASDHGHPAASYPRFGRGLLDPQPAPYEGALLGEFESHIPMIFVWPGVIEGGRRIAEPVSMIDMLPTLLDLVGLAQPEIAQGSSLGPVLRGEQGWQPRPVIFDEFRVVEGDELLGNLEVLDGQWGKSLEIRTAQLADKPELGRHPAPAGGRWAALEFEDVPRLLLYDVAADPRAIQHVNAEHPDVVTAAQRELLRLWREHVELAKQFEAGGQVALSPEQTKALQALGYIQ